MELQPDHGPLSMPDRHHHVIGRAGRHGQARGQRRLVDHQRMIPAGGQRIGQAGEHALSVVEHRTDSAVHRLGGTHDPGAERRANRLMAQADPEQGNGRVKTPDQLQRAARFARRARAGRQDDRPGLPTRNIVWDKRVVADHAGRMAQPLEIAGQVVHKTVVVVDQQDHRSALIRPVALCQVSSYSACGLDWATTPPPTGNCHQPRPAVMVLIRILRSSAPSKPR